ncbi:hypothetical protein PENSPDRAFT_593394, partial [Peniophora sp. CONT]
PILPDLKLCIAYRDMLRSATLDNDQIPTALRRRLRNPPQGVLKISRDMRLSINLYLAQRNASETTYAETRAAFILDNPKRRIYTHAQVKAKITEITGIVPIVYDMCPNSCIAYTGPLASLDRCPYKECREFRYDQQKLASDGSRIARRQFHTIPLGPQLQCLKRSAKRAEELRYLERRMAEIAEELNINHGDLNVFDDWCCGKDSTDNYNFDGHKAGAEERKRFCGDDFVLLVSLDGAQLYMMKASDCWIYIWVILNYDPIVRYKRTHILIGGVFPGPHKPKNVDSFLYPGLYHVSALQHEGLRVWDSYLNKICLSNLTVAFGTADTPGAVYFSGGAGHTSMHPCRLLCELRGRRKPDGKTYYPVHIRPDNYTLDTQPSYTTQHFIRPDNEEERYRQRLHLVLSSRTKAEYARNRKETGISRPSILDGLRRSFGMPRGLTCDLMHLGSLNIPDLYIGLVRASIECDKTDDVKNWPFAVLKKPRVFKAHGGVVKAYGRFLPTDFHAAPRDISEKVNSGYKAKEFTTYLYAYAPALLYDYYGTGEGAGLSEGKLPSEFHQHLCRLVSGMRTVSNRTISVTALQDAAMQLTTFVEDFEKLFCEGRIDRMHFCRPSIHGIGHLAFEIVRVGPLGILAQWTLERVIGLLVGELRQHSTPYAHLSQRGLHWCLRNAIKALIPELDNDTDYLPPKGAQTLSSGYVLLPAHLKIPTPMSEVESRAFWDYALSQNWIDVGEDEGVIAVEKWSRLRLHNGQVSRSAWKECEKDLDKHRMARNVKVDMGGQIRYGEVRYYFQVDLGKESEAGTEIEDLDDPIRTLAMVCLFSEGDPRILADTFNVLYICDYLSDAGLIVVDHTALESVVAAIPLNPFDRVLGSSPGWNNTLDSFRGPFFVFEKMGLEMDRLKTQ